MVAPITGPFSKVYRPSVYRDRTATYYKQRKPYNLPLKYDLLDKFVESQSIWGYASNGDRYTVAGWPLGHTSDVTTLSSRVYAKAYPKFVEAVNGARAELATTLAERQQSLDMIGNRSTQMLGAFRDVRRLRFGDAARKLGITRPPHLRDGRSLGRSAGSLWLEFWFGWTPLIGDIGTAVEILQGGVPVFRAKARASESSVQSLKAQNITASLKYYSDGFVNTTVKWHLEARVEVTNPNLHLANQLGFVNPVSLAWELVPFSFVVDWFVNVNDFLGSFSDFWGVKLIDPYYTRYVVTKKRQTQDWYYTYEPAYSWGKKGFGTVAELARQLGPPPGPSLVLRTPSRLSVTRALTSVSLLLQTMRK